jgi:hypothetical protein
LPSAVRGAGAAKSASPLAVRGIPGVRYGGHWAESDGEPAVKRIARPRAPMIAFT